MFSLNSSFLTKERLLTQLEYFRENAKKFLDHKNKKTLSYSDDQLDAYAQMAIIQFLCKEKHFLIFAYENLDEKSKSIAKTIYENSDNKNYSVTEKQRISLSCAVLREFSILDFIEKISSMKKSCVGDRDIEMTRKIIMK